MHFFSIITVVYNDEKGLRVTADSLSNQSFRDFEYIIIDGKSQDNTCTVAQDIVDEFKKKNIKTIFVSQKDKGIYDAMNKGASLSDGKWLLFLNAGDSLYNQNVLKKVSEYDTDTCFALYGSTNYKINNLHKIILPESEMNITKHMIFSHQSVFILKKTMIDYKYDISYRYVADFDFFLRCFLDGKSLKKIPVIISNFQLGGVSTAGNYDIYYEEILIQYNNGVLSKKEYEETIRELKKEEKFFKRRQTIKRMLPISILNWILKKSYIRKGFIPD